MKEQSQKIDMSLHSNTLYPDSEPTSLCSQFLFVYASRESSKYKLYAFVVFVLTLVKIRCVVYLFWIFIL